MPTNDQSHRLYRMWGSELSYFTGKVRPALRYKRLPYVELLPTPYAYREIIRARTGLAFIPTIVTPDDETWQDTSDILDIMEERFPDPPLYPRTPVQRIVAYLWELYADEFFVIPALHYRWSFPESETKARADFAASTGNIEQADAFATRIKSFTPFVGITPDTIPAIEAHTRALLDGLDAHFAAQPYLLGGRPSLADCALVGGMYAHLYLDAVPSRMLRAHAPHVCFWIERMNHPDPDAAADWLPGDALAPTLRPLLELIGRDATPMLLDAASAVEAWADTRPPDLDEPPRGVGSHETRLCGVACQRVTSPYTLWMLQRPLDAYRALPAADRAAVDRAVRGTGWEALLAYAPRHRVGKRRSSWSWSRRRTGAPQCPSTWS